MILHGVPDNGLEAAVSRQQKHRQAALLTFYTTALQSRFVPVDFGDFGDGLSPALLVAPKTALPAQCFILLDLAIRPPYLTLP